MTDTRTIEQQSMILICGSCGWEHGKHAPWCSKVLRGLILQCDECDKWFTAQWLPIHKCEPPA